MNLLRPNLFSLRFTDVASASATQRSVVNEPWLLAQRLSLDTPVIAITWQWFFARTFHIAVGYNVLIVTAICVWMIYVSDHLLDARRGLLYSSRHRFVARHERGLLVSLTLAFRLHPYSACFFRDRFSWPESG